MKGVAAADDYWVGPPERALLCDQLFAVACMDTAASHETLVSLLRSSPSHLVRADVLEAIAFEKERFDLELVRSFASEGVTTPELLSALYALRFSRYVDARPYEARARLEPLLRHDYPLARAMTIEVLMHRAENVDLILPLADDPSEMVRQIVEEAKAWIK